MVSGKDLPLDVLPVIVGHLGGRTDLCNATLVNKAFYRATVPVLYEKLDSRLISSSKGLIIHHPAETLIQKPKLARYVHSVKENGTLHGAPQTRARNIHVLAVHALGLCTSLRSFSWVDDNFLPDDFFLAILDVLKTLPLREITICTFKNLGNEVWDVLHQFSGLKSVSIFCMEGPPRILQGWSETLSPTLTHLDLGRCSGVPPTLLLSVFSHLRSLTHLRIKGAHSPSLPYFVAALPQLRSLDTDYTDSGSARAFSASLHMPALEKLTLRAGSIDAEGPIGLWACAQMLLKAKPDSLREFHLHTFAARGETSVPRPFILFLSGMHGNSLQRFLVGTTILLLDDVACICDKFPRLEELSSAISDVDTEGIQSATVHAYNLRKMRFDAQMLLSSSRRIQTLTTDPRDTADLRSCSHDLMNNSSSRDVAKWVLYDNGMRMIRHPFSIHDARFMMLRPQSRLRYITIGPLSFRGEWVYDLTAPESVSFEVVMEHVENTRREA